MQPGVMCVTPPMASLISSCSRGINIIKPYEIITISYYLNCNKFCEMEHAWYLVKSHYKGRLSMD